MAARPTGRAVARQSGEFSTGTSGENSSGSDKRFSVDGTLTKAWASHKSFQAKPGIGGGKPPDAPPPPATSGRNTEQNWRGQTRSNETHRSLTDPDTRLARKSNGQASILAYAGHVLMENRNGLVAQSCLTHATGTVHARRR